MMKLLLIIVLSSLAIDMNIRAEERCYGLFHKKCYEIDMNHPETCNNPRYCNENEFAKLEKQGIKKIITNNDYTIYI